MRYEQLAAPPNILLARFRFHLMKGHYLGVLFIRKTLEMLNFSRKVLNSLLVRTVAVIVTRFCVPSALISLLA